MPLFRHGKPQPCGELQEDHPIPEEWDDDVAAGPTLEGHEDFLAGEGEPVLEEPEGPADVEENWEDRVQKWNERWRAIVEHLTDPVEVVPLVFVEPIASKRAPATLKGLQRIYTRIRLLNYAVRRIHSDSGREFANSLFEKWALARDIAVTASIPSDPRSNGRVEGVVGQCKAGIRGLLIQSGLAPRCWPHLARQWAEQKLRWGLSKLGAETPKRALVPAGTVVTVKKREWSRKTPWSSKAVQGVAVAPSVRVPDATIIRIEEDGQHRLYIAPVVYTDVKEPIRFVGTAETASLAEDLPAPERRVTGKSPGVFQERGGPPRGESAAASSASAASLASGLGPHAGSSVQKTRVGAGEGSGSGDGAGSSNQATGASARTLSQTQLRRESGIDRSNLLGDSFPLKKEEVEELMALPCWSPAQTERCSSHLLSQNRPPQRAELEEVLRRSLQDFQAKTRAVDLHAKGTGAKAWTLGFYVYGNKVGLTNRTRLMPQTVRLLNSYLQSLIDLPEDAPATWAALRVTWGMQANLHQDRNMKGSKNWVVPVSKFQQGRLWVAADEGEALSEQQRQGLVQWNGVWGRFYEGDEKGVWFDSSKPHAVEEAVGDRIVIVAYTPRGIFKGAKQDVALLQELGFKIPSGNTNHRMTSVVGTQFGKEPQYFDISSDSEEGSFEGEWGSTGEPKNQDQRVERMFQLVREERKALDEELQLGAVCMTPALLAELQEDLRIAELLQEHDECERDVELGCSRLALHRLASVELALEDAWKSVEKTSMPQVRAMRRPVGSSEARGVPSLQPVEAPVEEAVDHDRELVEPVVRGLRDGVELDLCSGLVQGESAGESHPSFGEETPELTAKGALPTPGALLQTRIVPQSEIWDNLEAWRQPLTDEVTALKNVHQAVWPIGPEELKKLEALAQVSVIPAKGVYTQKPISGRLRARIVGCGNYLEAEPPESDGLRGKVRTQDLYAGGVDGVTIRLQTSMAAVQGWASAGLDIKTAFLGAPLYQDQQGQAVLTPGDLNSNSLDFDLLIKKLRAVQGERVKIAVVNPPKILVRLGLIEESEKWLVIKALYGLAEAPRRWSAHRDLLLRKISWEEGERKYFLVQCVADNNLWRIVSQRQPESTEASLKSSAEDSHDSQAQAVQPSCLLETAQADSGLGLHGLLGVYVDDMLITAETATQTRLIQELRAVWNTSEPEFAEVGRPIRFCGFNLHRLTGGGYLLNQEDYVQDLLQRFSDIQGTSEVPCLKEEEIEPEEPCPKQLKRAQMLTGALQWITTRTRPDICFAVNKTAQLMSKFPAYATRYAENIIRYLRSTPGLGLVFKPLDEQCRFGKSEELTAPRAAGLLEVFADASFGPTSNKSQTGIVAVFCGAVVAWASHRQSTTAQSSAEAELYSSLDGVLMLEVLESLAREISSVTLRKILYTDSLGCLSLFTAPAGAWRTRHLRLKARAGREKL